MKALIYNKGVEFKTDIPVKHLATEALIKVLMAGICNTDLEIIKGYMGFSGILGHEFVGIVEKADNKDFIGKRVSGEINCVCNQCYFCLNNIPTHCSDRTVLGIFNRDGVFSEYTSLPEQNLHILPDNISDEEAVFVEPLAAAFEILEQLSLTPDDRVVVLGDGKLGLLIAQVLSLYTKNLIIVGKHPGKLALLEPHGIETILLDKLTATTADIVVEATGSPQGLNLALNIVRPRGTIVLKTTLAEYIQMDVSKIVINEIKLIGSRCGPFRPAIEALSNKSIDVRSLISEIFPLEESEKALNFAATPGVLKVLIKI